MLRFDPLHGASGKCPMYCVARLKSHVSQNTRFDSPVRENNLKLLTIFANRNERILVIRIERNRHVRR